MTKSADELLVELHHGIEKISENGPNAVSRRILGMIGSEINRLRGTRDFEECPDLDTLGRFFDGAPRVEETTSRTKTFARTVFESRADRQRLSVFVDPVENVANGFLDFLNDAVSVLEFSVKSENDIEVVEAGHALALKMFSRHQASRSITVPPNHDPSEYSKTLLSAARRIKLLMQNELDTELERDFVSPFEGNRVHRNNCTFVGTKPGPERWVDNGKRIIQEFTDIYSCVYGHEFDDCCGNFVYKKKEVKRTINIWIDNGDSSDPPPDGKVPPKFEPYEWDNDCRVFESRMGFVTSDFGWRDRSGPGEPPKLDFHPGIDIGVPVGTPVLSTVEGSVVLRVPDSGDGRSGVHIRDGDLLYVFWHVDPSVEMGGSITVGQQIGVTGKYSRPHLHYAQYISPNGLQQDFDALNPCP